ncbi:recombinase family protein, partial [filamentous cyanobacterium CCP5]
LADSLVAPSDYVLVRRLEELGNSLADVASRLQQLEAQGSTVIAIEQPYPGPASEHPPSPQQLIALWHEVQLAQRSRRLRQGHAQNRLEALPPPGRAPYGYRRGQGRYVIDRAAAPVVKGFFEQFLLYGSLRQAVRYLEKKFGRKISVSTGQRWLTHPVYRGDLAYGDQQVIRDTHAAILSRDEAAQVDRLLRRNRRLPPRTASAPRSLAGLVSCQACGSGLKVSRVKTQKRDYLYMTPKGCDRSPKCRSIAYDGILKAAVEVICRDLPKAVATLEMPDLDQQKQALLAQVEEKQALLEQLPQLVDQGIFDAATAQLRAYRLKGEIAGLQQQQTQLPPVNLRELAQSVSIPQFWFDLSEAERRFFFREFIRSIQIIRSSIPDSGSWNVQVEFVF